MKINPGQALCLAIILLLTSCSTQKHDLLTIAGAANMRFALKDLVKAFEEEKGIECELIISSSGTLTAQIAEGAPYDVFVAANMKYPKKLFESGFSKNPPKVYASGKLVLWTMGDYVPNTERLILKTTRHIAIANPKLAPYGSAAIEFLNNNNIYEKVKDKLVFGESISQTNQFIVSKAAEVGITSMSTVLSPEMKGKGKWLAIDASAYSPIRQGAVIIKRKSSEVRMKNAKEFYNFLFSESARAILRDFGYTVN